ncbi:hypothetical protein MMC25_002846 [Agyrium rufum]|nr:hypothetical protein [Agyrium rufum]
MTLALSVYSATFMRYSLAITPKNYLLFGCHIINFASQNIQGYRYLQYWHNGGREKSLAEQAKAGAGKVEQEAAASVDKGKAVINQVVEKVSK